MKPALPKKTSFTPDLLPENMLARVGETEMTSVTWLKLKVPITRIEAIVIPKIKNVTAVPWRPSCAFDVLLNALLVLETGERRSFLKILSHETTVPTDVAQDDILALYVIWDGIHPAISEVFTNFIAQEIGSKRKLSLNVAASLSLLTENSMFLTHGPVKIREAWKPRNTHESKWMTSRIATAEQRLFH